MPLFVMPFGGGKCTIRLSTPDPALARMRLMIGESSEPFTQAWKSREFELRDSALQLLYGIGLKLEYCIALVDESPDQAKEGLDAAITGLNQLIGELRVSMSDLK